MVRELHNLGYGRLRLAPGMAPSGCYWRGLVAPIRNILPEHGAKVMAFRRDAAVYNTGQNEKFFGWEDAVGNSPAELATKFISRFPDMAAAGLGNDDSYVRWYKEMVEATEPEGLIYAYSDWGDSNPACLNVIGNSRERKVPYPPPVESDD